MFVQPNGEQKRNDNTEAVFVKFYSRITWQKTSLLELLLFKTAKEIIANFKL